MNEPPHIGAEVLIWNCRTERAAIAVFSMNGWRRSGAGRWKLNEADWVWAYIPKPLDDDEKNLTFGEAMELVAKGYMVKRAGWEYPVFGPAMFDENADPEEVKTLMWFALPDELRPGEIGSEYEDDSYAPSDADREAVDWEIAG